MTGMCTCQFHPTTHAPVQLCPIGRLLRDALVASQHGFSAAIQQECQRMFDVHVNAARAAWGEERRAA